MQTDTKQIQEQNEKWFFGFWVRKYRISYLIILGVIVFGLLSVFQIPKESQPNVEMETIVISTVYPWASPQDVDSLITSKIYKEIKTVNDIKKITSSSNLGFSQVVITPKTGANTNEIKDKIENKVASVDFPDDAHDPTIKKLELDTNRVFSLILYDTKGDTSKSKLSQYLKKLKNGLENIPSIENAYISMSARSMWGMKANNDTIYDTKIILDEEKMKSFWLSLAMIANEIQSTNINRPIGNFEINNKRYDYRIQDKKTKSLDFLNTPIALPRGWYISLGEIATIEREYKNDIDQSVISGSGSIFLNGIGLTVNKTKWASIFTASKKAKKYIEATLQTPEFKGLAVAYTYDLGKYIIQDYQKLANNAIATIVLVFVTMFLFVGLFDAIFATLTLPLAFLSTFALLNSFGYSMNFLTNFSLLLSFGIAIDTIVVIVQAANAKTRLGFSPRSAIALALKEYAVPVISGVSTTIVVFVPMMTLPGVMGKFLAFIPITIFWVLVSGLALALTVNSAIYLLLAKNKKSYIEDETTLKYMNEDEKKLLLEDRKWKELKITKIPLRNRFIGKITGSYKKIISTFLHHRYIRRAVIFAPIFFFILIQKTLTPLIDFQMFPQDDNDLVAYSIKSENGITTKEMVNRLGNLDAFFAGFPETDYVLKQIKNNTATITVNLLPLEKRKEKNMRSVFEINSLLKKRLTSLEAKGFQVTDTLASSGPPGGHPIGIKLVAKNYNNLSTLIETSKKLQSKIQKIDGIKNVQSSSEDTPGQFIFQINKELTSLKWIPSNLIYNTIISALNGRKIASIEDDGEDMDIILKADTFEKDVSLNAIENILFYHKNTAYRIGDFVDIKAKNSVETISQENGNIQIEISADVKENFNTSLVTKKATKIAEDFNYPSGIEYKKWWETEENSDLIIAMVSAFFTAILVIFGILTLQFDSYSKPLLVLYSVIMAFPFVAIGLLLTDNPFSMPFAIGFIAFTGVAVNHGIILIDAVEQNKKRGMEPFLALVEAGATRLEPMLVTTLTTVLGILPIALQNKFWAGMGFTIIFGLIATTFITLFVVTAIYYELYTRQKGSTTIKILKWLWKKFLEIFKNRKKK